MVACACYSSYTGKHKQEDFSPAQPRCKAWT
jgi:hypothetical protein